MNGEIIVFAIIPKKNKSVKIEPFNNDVELINCDNIINISPHKLTDCKFTNSTDIFITQQVINNTFIDRLRFCYKYLFKYN